MKSMRKIVNGKRILVLLYIYVNLFAIACKKNSDTAGGPGTNSNGTCDNIAVSNVPFTTCGNIMFQLPQGWQLEADGENFVLRLPFISGNSDRWVNMAVVKGFTSSSNIETDYNTIWQKYLSDFTKYQEPFLSKDKSIKGYDIVRGGTNVRTANNVTLYAHLWVAKVKDQAEATITFANYSNDFDISFYENIAPFWARLQFKNLQDPVKPCYTLRGDGIQGIYIGSSNGLNVYGNYGKKFNMLLVYSDQRVKNLPFGVLPQIGMNAFEREVDREVNKQYWADYNVQTGKATFNGTPTQVKNFTRSNDKVNYDNEEYIKMPAVDKLMLSGIYTADNTPLAITTFGYEPTIKFFTDGRFEDNTALYYVNGVDPKFKTPGNGRYTISNYSVELTYDDGRGNATFPFLNFDKDNITSIQINNVFLFKK